MNKTLGAPGGKALVFLGASFLTGSFLRCLSKKAVTSSV